MPILHVTRGVTRWTTRTTAEPPPVLASLQCSGDLGPVLANPAHCDDEERYGDVHWDVWDLAGCSLATQDLVHLHSLERMLGQPVREPVTQNVQIEQDVQVTGRRVCSQRTTLPRATRQDPH